MSIAHIDLRRTEEGRYLATTPRGRYYYIGGLLYEILRLTQQRLSPTEISERLRGSGRDELSPTEITAAIDRARTTFGETNEAAAAATGERGSYINFRLRLLPEALLNRVVAPLTGLFAPTIAIGLVLLSLLLLVLYYLSPATPGTQVAPLLHYPLLYAALFVVFLIHELGHATATRYYGIRPSEVSFGFYLVFPVFFADVSKIWALDARKRIIVNLGGIYFQLLVNIVLTTLYLSGVTNLAILHSVVLTNLLVIAYSLIPFLRYDGYWIYSDYFGIPNLMRRSFQYPYELLTRPAARTTINVPLLVYGVLNVLLMLGVGFFVGRFVTHSLTELFTQLVSSEAPLQVFSGLGAGGMLRLAVTLFMAGFLLRVAVRNGSRFLNYL